MMKLNGCGYAVVDARARSEKHEQEIVHAALQWYDSFYDTKEQARLMEVVKNYSNFIAVREAMNATR